MRLSQTDEAKLAKAHPDLVKVVRRAAQITACPFKIGETARSLDQQKKNVANGVSHTLRSRHLVSPDGRARAVDLLAMPDGKTVTWSWPPYSKLAEAMKQAANDVGVPIEWGGDWKTLKDGPHFQLPWSKYP
jgi:peptidoglycan L-alanyl-D-glutamate endopeptidase CwlK